MGDGRAKEDIMSREAVVIDPKEMGRKAEKIYADIRGDLEPEYKGKVVAIDVETGDYFLLKNDTLVQKSLALSTRKGGIMR